MGRKRTDQKVNWAIRRCYKEMYSVAQPSANFNALIASGEAKEHGFFLNYYLCDSRQDRIIGSVCRRYGLRGEPRKRVFSAVGLGSSPNRDKELWVRRRTEGELGIPGQSRKKGGLATQAA